MEIAISNSIMKQPLMFSFFSNKIVLHNKSYYKIILVGATSTHICAFSITCSDFEKKTHVSKVDQNLNLYELFSL